MTAEFHLAKNPLSLHLLLQHFESLVDIIVTDKNLHVVSLFARKVDRPEQFEAGRGALTWFRD